MAWIFFLHTGHKIALYCSDVSGAFDRVPVDRLLAKLRNSGVHPKIVKVIESWLGERSVSVIVDGTTSKVFFINNSVYQGTTWGPPFWNHFYGDAKHAITDANFIESIFADDLNAFQGFKTSTNNEYVETQMQYCQQCLHKWGHANQVVFDPAKEQFVNIHPNENICDHFKLLGINFDSQLTMEQGIREVAGQSHSRISMIMRRRRYYSKKELLGFYKSFVLGFIECATPAFYHATPFALTPLDWVQNRMLEEVGSSIFIFVFIPVHIHTSSSAPLRSPHSTSRLCCSSLHLPLLLLPSLLCHATTPLRLVHCAGCNLPKVRCRGNGRH